MSKDSPYQPPRSYNDPPKPLPGQRPPQWWLFQLYCGVMAAVYFLLAAAGGFLLFFSGQMQGEESIEALIYGVMFLILGPAFGVLFGVGLLLPRRRWAWGYAMALICLGLTGCCAWPFAIPLLIIWMKPETKEYFPV